MLDPNHSDRAALLRAKGGPKAALFWLARRALHLDVYRFYAIALAGIDHGLPPPLPDGYSVIALRNPSEISTCNPHLVEQLDARSGCGVATALRQHGRVYAITDGHRVVAQLRIDFQYANVDTPTNLIMDFGEKSAFLSFLYTVPSSRRSGWATYLISAACADLARDGVRVCVCHVQATNVRSINTFVRSGWIPIALLVTTTGKRRLWVHRSSRAAQLGIPLKVSPI